MGKKLRRFEVAGLPLIEHIIRQLRLREILAEGLDISGREQINPADVLVLLATNMVVARDPLYELGEWVEGLDLKPLGFPHRPKACFSDDRFGRALDKLYEANRASLQSRLVLSVLTAFDVQCDRIHNDSTSVKAYGRIPGRTRTGLELRQGHSKDHRPDLKQLIFTLSISADAAVPLHHHVYSGNRNDETTHIETWNTLRRLHGRADFLYVADCKLCTRAQLAHIVGEGGHAITVVPQGLNEARAFIETLRNGPVAKKGIWRRPKPNDESITEYFSVFDGDYRLNNGGYPIHWFHSSEKRKRDRYSREQRLDKTEQALAELATKLNTPRLRKQRAIRKAIKGILDKYRMQRFLSVRIIPHIERTRLRPRGRPPGQKARYRIRQKVTYGLRWERDHRALQAECRVDGVFPLLCTDPRMPSVRVLKAWKYQPRLEKRFEQFKHVHRAAPLLFKKIERVEANMFIFFVSLIIQALLERTIRQALDKGKRAPLKLYPEDRESPHPTTSQILKTFSGISKYTIADSEEHTEEYKDELKPVHREVLEIMGISESQFWGE